jgi:hypothetical protein
MKKSLADRLPRPSALDASTIISSSTSTNNKKDDNGSRRSSLEGGGGAAGGGTNNNKEPSSARSSIFSLAQSPMINTNPNVVGRRTSTTGGPHSPMINAVQTVVGRVGSILSNSSLNVAAHHRRTSNNSPQTMKSPKSAGGKIAATSSTTTTTSSTVLGGGDSSPIITFENSLSRNLALSEDDEEEIRGRTSLSNSKLRRRFSSSVNGTTLLRVLESERKLRVFATWLKSTHADESLELWNALNTLHMETDVKSRVQQSRKIAEKYLLPTSTRQVNLKSTTLRAVQIAYDDVESKAFENPDFFNDVQCEIFYDMMQSDAYMKFKLARQSNTRDSDEQQQQQQEENEHQFDGSEENQLEQKQ